MKHLVKIGLISAATLFAGAAAASGLDVYWVASDSFKIEESAGSDVVDESGTGFGLKFAAPVGATGGVVHGEYQRSSLDNLELKQIRAGGGWGYPVGPVTVGGRAEYLDLDIKGNGTINADGFGVHGRVDYAPPVPNLSTYAQLGYLALDAKSMGESTDANGFEFALGAAYAFNKTYGVFADYRFAALDIDDADANLDLSSLRLGVRVMFGGK